MPVNQHTQTVISFGAFEADLRTEEVRKHGVRLRLPSQSFRILKMLLERPGELATREELRAALWPADTFVDFEHSVNAAIRRLREALGDSADHPRLIETLPRRGYRLIVPVTGGGSPEDTASAEILPSRSRFRGSPRYYGLVIFGAAIATVGALAVLRVVLRTPGVPRVVRFTQLTDDGQAKFGSMATDGLRIYFNETLSGKGSVIVQVSVKGGEVARPPFQLKQPRVLDLSSDGAELLVGNDEENGPSSLWMQPVAGGSPRRVGAVFMHGARFSPDGTSIIYGNEHDVYSVNRDGSSPRKLLTIDGVPLFFQFSPDGEVFRFSQYDPAIDDMAIMEATADGTGLHKMFQGCCGNWISNGQFFIFQNRPERRIDVWALPEERRFHWWKRGGKPTQLTAGPFNFQNPLPSKDGKEIFAIGESHRAEVIRYDSRSAQFVPYLSGKSAEGLAFSRDGHWVAYTSYPDGTLWRSKLDGSDRLQLTFLPMRVLLPRWSPDGKQIAFNATVPGTETWHIYMVSSEGGTPQRILPSEQSQMDVSWSPDGNSLAFGALYSSNTPKYIYTVDLRSRRVSTLPGSTGLYSPRWSPDGRYIAAITSEHTKHPNNLMLFDFATQKWIEEFGSGMGYPSWSRDGKYIYFKTWDDASQLVGERIVRLRLSDRKVERIVELKNVGRLTAGTIVAWLGLAPDDSPLVARDISTQEIYTLEMEWP